MLFRIFFIISLLIFPIFASENNNEISKVLIGGRYHIELSVTDSSGTWPVSIVFKLGDNGNILQSDIDYPADECHGKIASVSFRNNFLIIKEKITKGIESCPPGKYYLQLYSKHIYAAKQQNRFKSAEFLLEGVTSPADFDSFSLKPSDEGNYRIKHQNRGWIAISQTSNLHIVKQYLKEVPHSIFYRKALKHLTDLIIKSGNPEEMLHYAKHFSNSPYLPIVLHSILQISKKRHDWKLLSSLYHIHDKNYSKDALKTAKQWLIQNPSIHNALLYSQKFGALDINLSRVIKKTILHSSLRSWDLLISLYERVINLDIKKSILKHLLQLSKSNCPSERCWSIVELSPKSPQSMEVLSKFFLNHKMDNQKLYKLSKTPINTAFLSLLRSIPKNINNPVYLAISHSLYQYKNHVLTKQFLSYLSSLPKMKKTIKFDILLDKNIFSYYLALASDINLKWQMKGSKHELFLIVTSSYWKYPLSIDMNIVCKMENEKKEIRTENRFFLFVPVGEEKARYLITTYKCILNKQTLLNLRKLFSFVISKEPKRVKSILQISHQFTKSKKIEVLSFRSNVIGKALSNSLKKDDKPEGSCGKIYNKCMNSCNTKSSKGFFNDKDSCQDACIGGKVSCESGNYSLGKITSCRGICKGVSISDGDLFGWGASSFDKCVDSCVDRIGN